MHGYCLARGTIVCVAVFFVKFMDYVYLALSTNFITMSSGNTKKGRCKGHGEKEREREKIVQYNSQQRLQMYSCGTILIPQTFKSPNCAL